MDSYKKTCDRFIVTDLPTSVDTGQLVTSLPVSCRLLTKRWPHTMLATETEFIGHLALGEGAWDCHDSMRKWAPTHVKRSGEPSKENR